MIEWKVFKDLPKKTLYVSSEGSVKSFCKTTHLVSEIKLYNRNKSKTRSLPYLAFGYKNKCKKVLVMVHIVVAELFVGEKPGENYQVDHIDDNTRNNHYTNLRWLIKEENASKGGKKGAEQRWKKCEVDVEF